MKLVFSDRAWDDYLDWRRNDGATLARADALIQECLRSPFKETAKPEPLRGRLQGWWSRRITLEDRLVYRVTGQPPEQRLEIAQCRYHY